MTQPLNALEYASLWGLPPLGLIQQWKAEWDVSPDAHCDEMGYVAAKAAEYGYRLGYQKCLAEFEQAAMDIYPPPPSED